MSEIRVYDIELYGTTALIMHQDSVPWADHVSGWQKDPSNKGLSVAGDDRTPSWGWLGKTYHTDDFVAFPQENIMSCLLQSGARIPTGQKQLTFRAQTQSGMFIKPLYWDFYLKNGKQVSWPALKALEEKPNFKDHIDIVDSMGFSLKVKRAKVGTKKHIRVRPLFSTGWKIKGEINVRDDMITTKVVQQLFDIAGEYKGLGDWRPGGPTPGSYGTFTAKVKQVG